MVQHKNSKAECTMKDELKNSAKRHAHRLIKKIEEVCDLPSVVQDSIRTEMEYATLDGHRITMKQTVKEKNNEETNGNV